MSSVNNNFTTPGTASATGTNKTKTGVAAQKDMFLKILTTQLQNQNPLEPVKPQEFTSQLTQYSQLEQQMQFNEKLDKLIAAQSVNQVSPTSYLNTAVDFFSDSSPVQNGQAVWSYVATGASTVNLTVQDSTGATIYTGAGDISAGAHTFKLPSTLADGTPLKLIVTATNADGKTVESTINARANVNAVNTVDGATILEANGYFISSDLVTRVANIPATNS